MANVWFHSKIEKSEEVKNTKLLFYCNSSRSVQVKLIARIKSPFDFKSNSKSREIYVSIYYQNLNEEVKVSRFWRGKPWQNFRSSLGVIEEITVDDLWKGYHMEIHVDWTCWNVSIGYDNSTLNF